DVRRPDPVEPGRTRIGAGPVRSRGAPTTDPEVGSGRRSARDEPVRPVARTELARGRGVPLVGHHALGPVALMARSRLDPTGKRALFDAPVAAAPDRIGSGVRSDGRAALFSSAPRRAGTVLVTCSHCEARSRVSMMRL